MSLRDVYLKCAHAVAYISVETSEGTQSIGTGFHIGQGYFATAKHVIENNSILEIGLTQAVPEPEGESGQTSSATTSPRILSLCSSCKPFLSEIEDIAIFKVSEHENLGVIRISSIQDVQKSENESLLSNVICVGYPPIPLTVHPFQVVVDATVSALIQIRGSSYLSYVLSATARGGFSGGPIINDEGHAIGLVTESLVRDQNATETGFMACISMQAVADLALKHGWDPGEKDYYRDIETLALIKLALPATRKLNPHSHDLKIFVYDDNRDVFIEFESHSSECRDLAISAFSSVCPVKLNVVEGSTALTTPIGNPSPGTLKSASQEARDSLLASGYTLVREQFTDGWNWA